MILPVDTYGHDDLANTFHPNTLQTKCWDNTYIMQVVSMDGSSSNGVTKLSSVYHINNYRLLCCLVGVQWDIWIPTTQAPIAESAPPSSPVRDTLSIPMSHSVLPRASSHSSPSARPAPVESKSEIDNAATRESSPSPTIDTASSHPAAAPSAEPLSHKHEPVDTLIAPEPELLVEPEETR